MIEGGCKQTVISEEQTANARKGVMLVGWCEGEVKRMKSKAELKRGKKDDLPSAFLALFAYMRGRARWVYIRFINGVRQSAEGT